jgi:hypothetical protein
LIRAKEAAVGPASRVGRATHVMAFLKLFRRCSVEMYLRDSVDGRLFQNSLSDGVATRAALVNDSHLVCRCTRARHTGPPFRIHNTRSRLWMSRVGHRCTPFS